MKSGWLRSRWTIFLFGVVVGIAFASFLYAGMAIKGGTGLTAVAAVSRIAPSTGDARGAPLASTTQVAVPQEQTRVVPSEPMPPQAKPETRDLNRSKEARIHASCTDSLPLSDVPDLSLPPKKYRSLGLHASLPSRAVVGIDGDNRPARREQLPPPGEPQPRPAVAVPQEDTPARGGADLRGVNLRGADLWFADLREADLRGADLTEATLVSARLTGAKLQGAKLEGATLAEADLWFADLREADLRGADLTEATLVSARLTGAKLQGAKLEGATLAEADLWFADLREADLRGADLTEAKFAPKAQWGASEDVPGEALTIALPPLESLWGTAPRTQSPQASIPPAR